MNRFRVALLAVVVVIGVVVLVTVFRPPMQSLSGDVPGGVLPVSERIAALGGKLDAGPAQSGGWRIHARLPLSRGRA